MRYDEEVVFVTEGLEIYNPKTGDYIPGLQTEVTKWANVSDLGEDRKVMLFGNIKEKTKVVRLNEVYKEPFDWIEVEGVKYVVQNPKHFRHESVFYIGEA